MNNKKKQPKMQMQKQVGETSNPKLRRIKIPGMDNATRKAMEEDMGVPHRYGAFALLLTEDTDQALAMSVDGELLMSYTNSVENLLKRLDALEVFYGDHQHEPDETFLPSVASLMMYVETMMEADAMLNEEFDDEFEDGDFEDFEDKLDDLDEFPGNIIDFRRRPGAPKTDD